MIKILSHDRFTVGIIICRPRFRTMLKLKCGLSHFLQVRLIIIPVLIQLQ